MKRDRRGGLDRAVGDVVAARNCSGCGACVRIDSGLAMRLDGAGFFRPVRIAATEAKTDAVRRFDAICPGRQVNAVRNFGVHRHSTMGPVVSAWQAWATDPVIRHRGSSGGALTALVSWLVTTGETASFTGAGADPSKPERTVALSITSKEQALASSGSRYAPVPVLAQADLTPRTGLVAKPCEISAARMLLSQRGGSEFRQVQPADQVPLLLSFFCAGTPSQSATHRLLADLGMPANAKVVDLWYRGRGWPGQFTARAGDGRSVQASYEHSWGEHLGKDLQWRCKICPDGVGESADISAADYWQSDARGYPSFAEEAGRSALIARTARGHDVLTRAFAAGVLAGQTLDLDLLADVQPLQVARRTLLQARLLGTRIAGRRVPRYRGFGLTKLLSAHWREGVRVARASFGRVRADSVGRGSR